MFSLNVEVTKKKQSALCYEYRTKLCCKSTIAKSVLLTTVHYEQLLPDYNAINGRYGC